MSKKKREAKKTYREFVAEMGNGEGDVVPFISVELFEKVVGDVKFWTLKSAYKRFTEEFAEYKKRAA
jgi:hypothetical protein